MRQNLDLKRYGEWRPKGSGSNPYEKATIKKNVIAR